MQQEHPTTIADVIVQKKDAGLKEDTREGARDVAEAEVPPRLGDNLSIGRGPEALENQEIG